ncbi:hypothetical protein L198_05480 [Cryptococcus wingfieldii CBS 7118]|uniref:Uncharacterized protein n=1 Tax=Cryptococcus wingfieldii CBS 7118 TaxID=1295528 RepID=A0A1E3IVR8_9TREE|nr:hypothetical protein L198_05480 [Cryptococcus wingfieldii CBS 7118]ODN92687.1 hypothetical protein L198_05480 [Cryptococcus wingfieldii CBS 7118]
MPVRPRVDPGSVEVHWSSSVPYKFALAAAQKFYVLQKNRFNYYLDKISEESFLTADEGRGSSKGIKLWGKRVQDIGEKYAFRRNIVPISVFFIAVIYTSVSNALCASLVIYVSHVQVSVELYKLLDSLSSECLVLLDHLSQQEVIHIKP